MREYREGKKKSFHLAFKFGREDNVEKITREDNKRKFHLAFKFGR